MYGIYFFLFWNQKEYMEDSPISIRFTRYFRYSNPQELVENIPNILSQEAECLEN